MVDNNEKKLDYRIDLRYQVASYYKYLEDIEGKNLNKLCMTEIVNADLSIAMVGEEHYMAGCAEVLKDIQHGIDSLGLSSQVFLYVYSYKRFIVAASEDFDNEAFTNLMQTFYDQYELARASNTELSGISRFVLVFGKEDMINRATSAHFVNRNSQINFFVATDERDKMREDFQAKMKVFELIEYAITNDSIVPFYQGIHDNTTGKIYKYEALMRIYDADGKLHTPASFLDDTKELKLYPKISKIMLDKALKDFENKESELSVNISLYDLQSRDFADWFLERLSLHPNTSKITIEFVETENYNGSANELLFEFIKDAKAIGCKIAIDDFGVGFATYTSIISLKPDIIKIDGDIIRNLHNNEGNKIILNSICYMTKLIGAKTVAEFIENKEIQDIVVENGVNYSQGYYFAKPLPLSDLDIK